MFCNLLKYDLKLGIKYSFPKILLLSVVSLSSCIMMDSVRNSLIQKSQVTGEVYIWGQPTYYDYLLYLTAGMEKHIPSPTTSFVFPTLWICYYLVVLYSVLGYPLRDMKGFGAQILLVSGNRKYWWFSKLIWIVTTIFLDFLVSWLTISIYASLTGVSFAVKINEGMKYILRLSSDRLCDLSPQFILEVMVLPLIAAICLGFLQVFIALITKPIIGYVVVGSVLLVSAYFQSPWLIGNYMMPVRSNLVVEDGMKALSGILLSAALIIVLAAFGSKVFARYGILGKEEDA